MHTEKYTERGVEKRGNEICREWKSNKYNSHKIVSIVRLAVDSMCVKGTVFMRFEALACLFALDLRIKERYRNIIRRIVFCFARRRESRVLEWAKVRFGASADTDIRTLIGIELENIRLMIEDSEDDVDGEAKGGRIRLSAEESDLQTNVHPSAEKEADKRESAPDSKEKREEQGTVENIGEDATRVEKNVQNGADSGSVDHQIGILISNDTGQGMVDSSAPDRFDREKIDFINQENNGSLSTDEPIKDIAKENRGNSVAVDLPPRSVHSFSEKQNDKISFLDEVTLDALSVGGDDLGGNGCLNSENNMTDVRIGQEAANGGDTQKSAIEKNAHLYDKMVLDRRIPTAEVAPDTAREPNAGDIADKENEIRGAINNFLPEDTIKEFKAASESELRHQISVYCNEQGIKGPADKVGAADPAHLGKEAPVLNASERK